MQFNKEFKVYASAAETVQTGFDNPDSKIPEAPKQPDLPEQVQYVADHETQSQPDPQKALAKKQIELIYKLQLEKFKNNNLQMIEFQKQFAIEAKLAELKNADAKKVADQIKINEFALQQELLELVKNLAPKQAEGKTKEELEGIVKASITQFSKVETNLDDFNRKHGAKPEPKLEKKPTVLDRITAIIMQRFDKEVDAVAYLAQKHYSIKEVETILSRALTQQESGVYARVASIQVENDLAKLVAPKVEAFFQPDRVEAKSSGEQIGPLKVTAERTTQIVIEQAVNKTEMPYRTRRNRARHEVVTKMLTGLQEPEVQAIYESWGIFGEEDEDQGNETEFDREKSKSLIGSIEAKSIKEATAKFYDIYEKLAQRQNEHRNNLAKQGLTGEALEKKLDELAKIDFVNDFLDARKDPNNIGQKLSAEQRQQILEKLDLSKIRFLKPSGDDPMQIPTLITDKANFAVMTGTENAANIPAAGISVPDLAEGTPPVMLLSEDENNKLEEPELSAWKKHETYHAIRLIEKGIQKDYLINLAYKNLSKRGILKDLGMDSGDPEQDEFEAKALLRDIMEEISIAKDADADFFTNLDNALNSFEGKHGLALSPELRDYFAKENGRFAPVAQAYTEIAQNDLFEEMMAMASSGTIGQELTLSEFGVNLDQNNPRDLATLKLFRLFNHVLKTSGADQVTNIANHIDQMGLSERDLKPDTLAHMLINDEYLANNVLGLDAETLAEILGSNEAPTTEEQGANIANMEVAGINFWNGDPRIRAFLEDQHDIGGNVDAKTHPGIFSYLPFLSSIDPTQNFYQHPKDKGMFGRWLFFADRTWWAGKLGIGRGDAYRFESIDRLEGLLPFGLAYLPGMQELRKKMEIPAYKPKYLLAPDITAFYGGITIGQIYKTFRGFTQDTDAAFLMLDQLGGSAIDLRSGQPALNPRDFLTVDEYRNNPKLLEFLKTQNPTVYKRYENRLVNSVIDTGEGMRTVGRVTKGQMTVDLLKDIQRFITNDKLKNKWVQSGQFDKIGKAMMREDHKRMVASERELAEGEVAEKYVPYSMQDVVLSLRQLDRNVGEYKDGEYLPDDEAMLRKHGSKKEWYLQEPWIKIGDQWVDAASAKHFITYFYYARLYRISEIGAWGSEVRPIIDETREPIIMNQLNAAELQANLSLVDESNRIFMKDGEFYHLRKDSSASAALVPVKKRADGSPDYESNYGDYPIVKTNNVTGIPSAYKAFHGFNDNELAQAFGQIDQTAEGNEAGTGEFTSISNDGFIDNVTFTDISHLYDGKDLEFYWTIKAAQANAHRATSKVKKEIWENLNNTEDLVRWIIFGSQIIAFLNPAMFGMLANPGLLLAALAWSVAVSPFINRMKNGTGDADVKSVQQWNAVANERQRTIGWGSEPIPSSEIAFAKSHKENIKEMWKQGVYDVSKSGVPVSNYAGELTTDFLGKFFK